MGQLLRHLMHLHFNAQFLGQFAPETLLETFARLQFAAGKFPQAAQVGLRQPPGDEQLPASKNQARRHVNGTAAGQVWVHVTMLFSGFCLLILIIILISAGCPESKNQKRLRL